MEHEVVRGLPISWSTARGILNAATAGLQRAAKDGVRALEIVGVVDERDAVEMMNHVEAVRDAMVSRLGDVSPGGTVEVPFWVVPLLDTRVVLMGQVMATSLTRNKITVMEAGALATVTAVWPGAVQLSFDDGQVADLTWSEVREEKMLPVVEEIDLG
jgi:flavin-binding protein dodecin